jgi:hypothetical protein
MILSLTVASASSPSTNSPLPVLAPTLGPAVDAVEDTVRAVLRVVGRAAGAVAGRVTICPFVTGIARRARAAARRPHDGPAVDAVEVAAGAIITAVTSSSASR